MLFKIYNKSWQIYVTIVTKYTNFKRPIKQLKTKFYQLKYSLWAKSLRNTSWRSFPLVKQNRKNHSEQNSSKDMFPNWTKVVETDKRHIN